MRILVQKFGGTSVATEAGRNRITTIVGEAREQGFSVCVVVSAMGRAGDPYATDTLISLARSAYLEAAREDLDLLMSCGEIISTVICASTLRAKGIATECFTGARAGILTDNNHGNAQIVRVDTAQLLRALAAGKVGVVAGFQGVTESGAVTTLGRGGSDTSAVAIGAALPAEAIEIYTDVDGIMTADPRIVPEARTIDTMTYEEISEMAHQGAKVIHPRAVEIAMKTGVPLRIKSTFINAPGTLIKQKQDHGFWPEAQHIRPVTGITHMDGLCRIEMESQIVPMSRVFRVLALASVSVDMIAVTEATSSFVIKEESLKEADAALRGMGLSPQITRELAKVSIVGVGMRGMPGVMANVAESLHDANVRILQTTDSHTTISCLVPKQHVETAMRALHARFGLNSSQ